MTMEKRWSPQNAFDDAAQRWQRRETDCFHRRVKKVCGCTPSRLCVRNAGVKHENIDLSQYSAIARFGRPPQGRAWAGPAFGVVSGRHQDVFLSQHRPVRGGRPVRFRAVGTSASRGAAALYCLAPAPICFLLAGAFTNAAKDGQAHPPGFPPFWPAGFFLPQGRPQGKKRPPRGAANFAQ